MPIDIVITNAVMARALPAEGMTEGTQYNVYINNVLVPNGPYTFENGRLVINDYRITQNDLTAGEIRITDIVAYNSEVDPDETYDITVSVTPEGTATVNIPASAKGGEVVTGTVSVTEGNELVSVTVNGTAVAVAADGTFSFTVSETNAVMVTTKTATPSTSDFTVKQDSDGDFTVEFESTKPADQDVIDEINKILAEDPDNTAVVDELFDNGDGTYSALDGDTLVAEVTYVGTFKVLYNGVTVGTITGSTYKDETDPPVSLEDGQKLIPAGTGNVNSSDAYTVSVDLSGSVTVSAPSSVAADKDITLVKGYAVTTGTSVNFTNAEYSINGVKGTGSIASGNLFPMGTVFTGIAGTATTADGTTTLTLKVNGNDVGTDAAGKDAKNDWTYTLKEDDLTKADGTKAAGFELSEEKATETDINIDGKTVTVTTYDADGTFALPTVNSDLDGKYIVLTGNEDDGVTDFSATSTNLVEINTSIVGGERKTQVTTKATATTGAYSDDDAALYLVKAADYTVEFENSLNNSYEITYNNAKMTTVNGEVYLPATDCTIYMGEHNGKDYRIVKTIDGKDDIMTLSNGVATYTVGEDTFAEDAASKAVSFAKEDYVASAQLKATIIAGDGVALPTVTDPTNTQVTVTVTVNGEDKTAGTDTVATGNEVVYTIKVTGDTGYYVDADTELKLHAGDNATVSAGSYNSADESVTFTVSYTVA